jgi:hypothetical protein
MYLTKSKELYFFLSFARRGRSLALDRAKINIAEVKKMVIALADAVRVGKNIV